MDKKQETVDRTIAKVMTRSAFLHVQDALSIGKIKIWIGLYQQGEGCKQQSTGFLDVDAAKVVFGDLLLRGGLPEKLYPEQKIEFYGGTERDGKITARVLRFKEDPSLRSPIVIEIATGPGKRNQKGGFKPTGNMETTGIFLDVFTARKLADTVLSDLQAVEIVKTYRRVDRS